MLTDKDLNENIDFQTYALRNNIPAEDIEASEKVWNDLITYIERMRVKVTFPDTYVDYDEPDWSYQSPEEAIDTSGHEAGDTFYLWAAIQWKESYRVSENGEEAVLVHRDSMFNGVFDKPGYVEPKTEQRSYYRTNPKLSKKRGAKFHAFSFSWYKVYSLGEVIMHSFPYNQLVNFLHYVKPDTVMGVTNSKYFVSLEYVEGNVLLVFSFSEIKNYMGLSYLYLGRPPCDRQEDVGKYLPGVKALVLEALHKQSHGIVLPYKQEYGKIYGRN